MEINFVFLLLEDLQAQIFDTFIDDSVQDDIDALEQIERQEISIFKTKLRQRFDVDAVFAQEAENRNQELVKHLAARVTYQMVRRNAARKVPSDYIKAYEEASQWLKDVRDGIETPDLPKIEERPELLWGNSRNEDYLL